LCDWAIRAKTGRRAYPQCQSVEAEMLKCTRAEPERAEEARSAVPTCYLAH
jgi:hypothetical protein